MRVADVRGEEASGWVPIGQPQLPQAAIQPVAQPVRQAANQPVAHPVPQAVFQQVAQPVAQPQVWIQLDDEGNVPPAQP